MGQTVCSTPWILTFGLSRAYMALVHAIKISVSSYVQLPYYIQDMFPYSHSSPLSLAYYVFFHNDPWDGLDVTVTFTSGVIIM